MDRDPLTHTDELLIHESIPFVEAIHQIEAELIASSNQTAGEEEADHHITNEEEKLKLEATSRVLTTLKELIKDNDVESNNIADEDLHMKAVAILVQVIQQAIHAEVVFQKNLSNQVAVQAAGEVMEILIEAYLPQRPHVVVFDSLKHILASFIKMNWTTNWNVIGPFARILDTDAKTLLPFALSSSSQEVRDNILEILGTVLASKRLDYYETNHTSSEWAGSDMSVVFFKMQKVNSQSSSPFFRFMKEVEIYKPKTLGSVENQSNQYPSEVWASWLSSISTLLLHYSSPPVLDGKISSDPTLIMYHCLDVLSALTWFLTQIQAGLVHPNEKTRNCGLEILRRFLIKVDNIFLTPFLLSIFFDSGTNFIVENNKDSLLSSDQPFGVQSIGVATLTLILRHSRETFEKLKNDTIFQNYLKQSILVFYSICPVTNINNNNICPVTNNKKKIGTLFQYLDLFLTSDFSKNYFENFKELFYSNLLGDYLNEGILIWKKNLLERNSSLNLNLYQSKKNVVVEQNLEEEETSISKLITNSQDISSDQIQHLNNYGERLLEESIALFGMKNILSSNSNNSTLFCKNLENLARKTKKIETPLDWNCINKNTCIDGIFHYDLRNEDYEEITNSWILPIFPKLNFEKGDLECVFEFIIEFEKRIKNDDINSDDPIGQLAEKLQKNILFQLWCLLPACFNNGNLHNTEILFNEAFQTTILQRLIKEGLSNPNAHTQLLATVKKLFLIIKGKEDKHLDELLTQNPKYQESIIKFSANILRTQLVTYSQLSNYLTAANQKENNNNQEFTRRCMSTLDCSYHVALAARFWKDNDGNLVISSLVTKIWDEFIGKLIQTNQIEDVKQRGFKNNSHSVSFIKCVMRLYSEMVRALSDTFTLRQTVFNWLMSHKWVLELTRQLQSQSTTNHQDIENTKSIMASYELYTYQVISRAIDNLADRDVVASDQPFAEGMSLNDTSILEETLKMTSNAKIDTRAAKRQMQLISSLANYIDVVSFRSYKQNIFPKPWLDFVYGKNEQEVNNNDETNGFMNHVLPVILIYYNDANSSLRQECRYAFGKLTSITSFTKSKLIWLGTYLVACLIDDDGLSSHHVKKQRNQPAGVSIAAMECLESFMTTFYDDIGEQDVFNIVKLVSTFVNCDNKSLYKHCLTFLKKAIGLLPPQYLGNFLTDTIACAIRNSHSPKCTRELKTLIKASYKKIPEFQYEIQKSNLFDPKSMALIKKAIQEIRQLNNAEKQNRVFGRHHVQSRKGNSKKQMKKQGGVIKRRR